MSLLLRLMSWDAALGRLLDWLRSPALLAARIYIASVFLPSGWLKLSSWSSTLDLFRDEYHVPLLPPELAAYVGTFGELFFPSLLLVGLFGRFSALAASAVNAMAVISYAHVLFSEGFEAAIGQHLLWAVLLAALAIFGPGSLSIDRLLQRRS
jgi:putative oxidoreductase